MGVAVREGAPKPDISTPEALKQALLAAKSLVYVDPGQGATSGIHFAGVLERLGIADAVRAKTRLVPGGYPAELVARGEVELVAHQISEIVPVKGVTLVGRLPKDLQKITTYSAGLAARSAVPEAARAFIAFVARPAFKARFAGAGLTTGSEDMTTSDREPGFAGAIESRGEDSEGGRSPPPSHLGELLEGVGGAQHRRVLPVSADQPHSARQS